MQIDLLRSSLIFFLTVLAGCTSGVDTLHSDKSSAPVESKAALASSDLSLRRLIAEQYPDIEKPQTSDWQKVNLLRRWAYRNIKIATASCGLENVLKPNFYQKSPSEMLVAFQQDAGGVLCGGAAVFMQKLYRNYGFKTYYLGIGKIGYMTHAVTLVEIQDRGTKKLAVEDAFLNVTYTFPDGSPLDYFELLSLLSQGNRNQVRVGQDKGIKRDFIFCSGNPIPDNLFGIPKAQLPCTKISGGKAKCRAVMVLKDLADRHPNSLKTKQFLVGSGYKPDFIYLFMFPFSINDETGERKDFLSHAQAIIKGSTSTATLLKSR